MMKTEKRIDQICERFKQELHVGISLDTKWGSFVLGGHICYYFYIEGFLNKQALERVMTVAPTLQESAWESSGCALEFVQKHLHFSECVNVNFTDAINRILAGFLVLVFEGFEDEFLSVELRTTPQRSIQEPSKGKTLRGPHEGFCENIVTNLALLRRRIKTTKLITREFVVGKYTQTRIALCYLEGIADESHVKNITEKLGNLNCNAICMGEESITERLFYRKNASLFNPLPRVRFSERPDTCSAELLEGKIVLLVDTTPNAIILPINLFDFFEECDNYYFPPATATYLKTIRFLGILAAVFLIPIWLLVLNQSSYVPDSLAFILVQDPYAVPIFLQLILIEIAIDSLKLASLNTPEPLANSLSVVGGLLLGDFAVKSGWFVPQTILYSAIATILNFIPNNYELGYSLKFWRIGLIVLVQLFGIWGLLGGTLSVILFLAAMRNSANDSYLSPVFPLRIRALAKIFIQTLRGKEDEN